MTERKQISLQKDNTQAALEFALTRTNKRLELFKEYNGGIPEKDLMREFAQNEGVYWEDLETIINGAKDQLDQYREDIGSDRQAALDSLARLEDILGETYIGSDFDTIRAALTAQQPEKPYIVDGDGALRQTKDVNEELFEALNIATNELEEHSKCEDCQVGVPLNILNKCHGAIALTAQLTKTDDNVSCPNIANTVDINAEMLEALRAVDAAAKSSSSIIGFAAKVFKLLSKIRKAIARAEQKGGK